MRCRKLICAAVAGVFALAPMTLILANDVAHQTQSAAKDSVHRASKIAGMTVKNNANKTLGEIDDVVIDVTSGDVRYLAVSYGGFLGLGDKLFAVPVDIFQLRQGDDADDYYLVLPVDEQTLKNAPGFDQDKWPNLADKSWNDKVNKHYGQYRRSQRDRSRADVDIRTGDTGVSVNIDTNRNRVRDDNRVSNRANSLHMKNTIHRTSDIIGMTVNNKANQELG